MITVKNLHKYYKMKKGKTFHALKGLNIKFPNKGFVFVAGKSGCGKSTLLNVIGGLDTYEKGHLIVGKKSTRQFSSEDMDNYRNSYLGFIFQDFHLIDGETIYDNVALALKLQGYKKEDIPKRVAHYLKIVDLYDKKNNKISEISGGQKQRVAIARALIKNPQVIIADEPTGNLDSKTGLLIMKILKKLSQSKLVIMVTHDIEYADDFADRVIQLKDGEIISDYDNSDLDYSRNAKLRFKRSKFPLNVALKMAWTSVIRKKIRLFFTVLLFTISIGLFSFTTSFNFYNTEDLFYQFIMDTNETKIQFSEGRNEMFEYKNSLDQASVEILRKRYPEVTFGRTDYEAPFNTMDCGYEGAICNYRGQPVFTDDIDGLRLDFIYGGDTFTSESIIISDITADFIINSSEYNQASELIGQTVFNLEDNGVTSILKDGVITGIYSTDKLDLLKSYDQEIKLGTFQDYNLLSTFRNYYTYIHNDLDTYVETYDIYGSSNYSEHFYLNIASSTRGNIVGTLPVNDNEILLSFNQAISLAQDALNELVESGDISEVTASNIVEEHIEANNTVCNVYNDNYSSESCDVEVNNFLIDFNNFFDLDGEEFLLELTPTAWSRDTFEETNLKTITFDRVSGISLDSNASVVTERVLTDFLQERENIEGSQSNRSHNVIAILSGNATDHQDFIRMIGRDYTHRTDASMALGIIDSFLNTTVKRVLLTISLVLGGFASILMYSYINQSIRFKRADIGTLRAIGAKGSDVGRIFITEAMIISIVSSVFAAGGLIYVVMELNQVVNGSLNLSFNFFYINVLVYFILFAFAAVIALLSCIIPLTRLIRMSPIDVIRKARD